MKKLIFIVLAGISINIYAQTAGTATFTVTNISNGGAYSPKNIIAIWMKNSSGTFIQTMKVMAQQRIQYLYKWKQSSGLNTVNAITGPTLSNFQTHTVYWNCKDNNGNIVPDGNYEFWVEYTDADVQGPYYNYSFNKGTSAVNITFPNQTYYKNVSIVYTPSSSDVKPNEIIPAKVIQAPFSSTFYFEVPTNIAENASLKIYSLDGKIVYETYNYTDDGNIRKFIWNSLNTEKGIFIYTIESGAETYLGKISKFLN